MEGGLVIASIALLAGGAIDADAHGFVLMNSKCQCNGCAAEAITGALRLK
jgi:hypothetical protein